MAKVDIVNLYKQLWHLIKLLSVRKSVAVAEDESVYQRNSTREGKRERERELQYEELNLLGNKDSCPGANSRPGLSHIYPDANILHGGQSLCGVSICLGHRISQWHSKYVNCCTNKALNVRNSLKKERLHDTYSK